MVCWNDSVSTQNSVCLHFRQYSWMKESKQAESIIHSLLLILKVYGCIHMWSRICIKRGQVYLQTSLYMKSTFRKTVQCLDIPFGPAEDIAFECKAVYIFVGNKRHGKFIRNRVTNTNQTTSKAPSNRSILYTFVVRKGIRSQSGPHIQHSLSKIVRCTMNTSKS